MNPEQITIAVFDRSIEKFREVLLTDDIDLDLVRDALKTLNGLIHHVETADVMVDQGIMEIMSGLLKSQSHEVREQAAYLCASFALGAIAR